MRRVLVICLIALAGALGTAAAQAPGPTITATCNGGACTGWFNTDVTVAWTLNPANGTIDPASPCTTGSVTTEGANPVACTGIWDNGMGGTISVPGSATVQIDKTAPTGVAAAPDRPPDSSGWYNHPVTFTFSGTDALSGLAGCSAPVAYSGPDGPGRTVTGNCTDVAGNSAAGGSPAFNYDATGPAITGTLPSRPPDHDGWYTHPVSFTFLGRDDISGIASCVTANYAGPDGENKVTGGCSDVAGNVSRATFAIKYDATRPPSPDVHVAPGNRRVDVSWNLPGDAATVTVSRSRQGDMSPPQVIYSGTGTSVLDTGLRNHTKYRYTVTDADLAGNTNSKSIAAVPTASSLRPFPGTAVNGPPVLSWKRVRGATYYNVQLYRGGTKVLSTWPRQRSLALPRHWRFRHRRYALAPGHYRWYVWPGFGAIKQAHYGKLLGRSSFRVMG